MSERIAAELAVDAERWAVAQKDTATAIRARDHAVRRADRQVVDATGGIGLRRWEADCRRRRARTARDALLHARALRARPAVQSALTRQRKTVIDADRAVATSYADLAAASAILLGYGNLGAAAVGVTVPDLRRLARRVP